MTLDQNVVCNILLVCNPIKLYSTLHSTNLNSYRTADCLFKQLCTLSRLPLLPVPLRHEEESRKPANLCSRDRNIFFPCYFCLTYHFITIARHCNVWTMSSRVRFNQGMDCNVDEAESKALQIVVCFHSWQMRVQECTGRMIRWRRPMNKWWGLLYWKMLWIRFMLFVYCSDAFDLWTISTHLNCSHEVSGMMKTHMSSTWPIPWQVYWKDVAEN